MSHPPAKPTKPRKRAVLAAAVGLVGLVVGGGWLAHTTYQEGQADLREKAERLDQATREEQALAQELEWLQQRGRGLEAEVGWAKEAASKAQTRYESMRGDSAAQQAELEAARKAAEASRGRVDSLSGELREVQDLVAIRQKALELAQRRAEEARLLAEARGKALTAELSRSQVLEERLRKATRLERERAAEVQALRQELARVRLRARRGERTLTKLSSSGVNLARYDGSRPMPQIEAIVVQIDSRGAPPLVIVNAGRSKGLEPKDILFIVRGGRVVARLQVDEVKTNLAATRLVQAERGLRLRTGDRVRSHHSTLK